MKKPIYKFNEYSIYHICDGKISYWEVRRQRPINKAHRLYKGGDGTCHTTFHSSLSNAIYKVISGITDRSEQVSLKHYADKLERIRDEFFAMMEDVKK